MSDESFLLTEYKACFEQLRFHDSREEELLKYLFTLTSAAAAAQFAILEFAKTPTREFYLALGFLSLVVFIATLLLFLMMLQNRLYFVFIARQLNALRRHLLKTTPEFAENQLYTSTAFSAFKWSSVHTMHLLGATFISALFAGSSAAGLLLALNPHAAVVTGLLTFLTTGALEAIGAGLYLKNASTKSADTAVHSQPALPHKP